MNHLSAKLAILLIVFVGSLPAFAQDSTHPTPAASRIGKPATNIETQVTVELLTGVQGVSFRAQSWTNLMQQMDIPLRIRRGFGDENETGLTEKMIGTSLREIRIVGRMEADGTIVVENRKFREGESARFKEWIKELRTYGVQGAPQGKPIWGLTVRQFEDVFASLAPVVQRSVAGTSLKLAVRDFGLPKEYPVVVDDSARQILDSLPEPLIETEVEGLSHGVGLSVILKEHGLGFFPRRTPDGKIELAIASREERQDVWPVGWPPQGEQVKLIPDLSKLTTLEAVDEPFDSFMARIRDVVRLPILYDRFALRNDQINLQEIKVNFPSKRITWISGLKAVLFKHRMRTEIVTDEAGHPYIWITSEPLKPLFTIPKEEPVSR